MVQQTAVHLYHEIPPSKEIITDTHKNLNEWISKDYPKWKSQLQKITYCLTPFKQHS